MCAPECPARWTTHFIHRHAVDIEATRQGTFFAQRLDALPLFTSLEGEVENGWWPIANSENCSSVDTLYHVQISLRVFGTGHHRSIYRGIVRAKNSEALNKVIRSRENYNEKIEETKILKEENCPRLSRLPLDTWVPYLDVVRKYTPEDVRSHQSIHAPVGGF
jgi:hypothetical protein